MGNPAQAQEPIERKVNQTLIRLEQGDLTALPAEAFVFYAHEDKGIPVVFVAGVSGPGGNVSDADRFYTTRRQVPPPDGFIAKPIDAEETLALVQRFLGTSSS
jgi:hypothetical protein